MALSSPSPDGSHDLESATIPEPKWQGDHRDWKKSIENLQRMADELRGGEPCALGDHLHHRLRERPPSENGVEIATTVFYTAADYNTLYRSPLPVQIELWAQIYDLAPWLTADLARRAVHAHFDQSDDGHMQPGHVIQQAKRLIGGGF